MRGALRLVLFASGCSQFFGLDQPVGVDARGVGDIGQSGDGATADARSCFGSGEFAVCLRTLPTQSIALTSGSTLDTTSSSLCASGPSIWVSAAQPAACFVIATTITVSDLRVTGSRFVVFVASDSITVGGRVDAASHGLSVSPGAPVGPCASAIAPGSSANGGGGGAGGSFMSRGGDGGTGNNGLTTAGLAAPADALAPGVLRGGCGGQRGAAGGIGASGGLPGGAVYLVAGNSITLGPAAIISVSGAGAEASSNKGGGGGGGSGGMIVLYAPSIMSSSSTRLVANGGGGSAGASTGNGAVGMDPDLTTPLVSALGGTGAGGAGSGGDGFAVGSPAVNGQNGSSSDGGGGGGGGAGYIRANVALGNVVASPTPAIVP